MLDVAPELLPKYFCHDSAADAAHLFQLLRHLGTIPIVDKNKRHEAKGGEKGKGDGKDGKGDNDDKGGKGDGDPQAPQTSQSDDEADGPREYINEDGNPVCRIGVEVARDGYDKTKMATKYRCPATTGKLKDCPYLGICSKTDYGRVKKIYEKTDYKRYGPVPWGTEKWKDIYKDRTCTERVNNRVLNDYKVQHLTCRNGRKHFFFEIVACVNIHLDAWAKTG